MFTTDTSKKSLQFLFQISLVDWLLMFLAPTDLYYGGVVPFPNLSQCLGGWSGVIANKDDGQSYKGMIQAAIKHNNTL